MKTRVPKRWTRSMCFVGAATLMTVAAGCGRVDAGATDEGAEVSAARSDALATLSLEGGATVRFFEPEAGRIVVQTIGDLGMQGEGTEGLPPVQFYERLAGAAAPEALQRAQERADLARAAWGAPGAEGETSVLAPVTAPELSTPRTSGGLGTSRHALTAADFQANWCGSGLGSLDFDYCWTTRTNDYSIEIASVDWIHAHANAVSGSFTMSLYYKNTWGNWILVFSDTVSGSSNVTTQSTTKNDRYKVSLVQAAGDTYHLAIHGEK